MTSSQLRRLLASNELPQSVAARLLDIDPRTMRRYIAGDLPVPKVVELALEWVVMQQKQGRKS
jgi:hypothetical protein